LFTPGDIIYSSSALIESGPRPIFALDKLLTLMEAERITFNRLRDALNAFRGASRSTSSAIPSSTRPDAHDDDRRQ